MRQREVWKYLIAPFAAFWLLFAVILIVGDIPFMVISMALTGLLVLSFLVIVLAWAYQNNL